MGPAAVAHAPPPRTEQKASRENALRIRRRVSARLRPAPGELSRVPAWWGAEHWAKVALPVAYGRGGSRHHPVSLDTATMVARGFAGFADRRTGRACHPTNEQVAALAHCSVRTVQRVRRLLEDLGLMVTVVEGRSHMTREQRLQAWRNGSCARQLAAEVALTLPRHLARVHRPGPRPVDDVTPPGYSEGDPGSPVKTRFFEPKARMTSDAPRRTHSRRPPPAPTAAGARSQRLVAGVQRRIGWLSGVSPRRLTSLHRLAAQRWTPRDVQLALDGVLKARGWTVPDHVENPPAYLAALLRGVDPADRPGAVEEAMLAEERIRRAWAHRVNFDPTAPRCPHGEPLGNVPHPLTAVRSCPLCRRASDGRGRQ